MAGFFLTPPRINKCCGGGGGTGRSGQPKQRIRDVSQYSEKKRKDGMTSDNLFSSRYRNRDTGEGGGRHIISSSFPRFLFFLCTCRCCRWNRPFFPRIVLFFSCSTTTEEGQKDGTTNSIDGQNSLSLLPGSLLARPTFADCFSRAKRRHVSPRREEICPPPTWVPTTSFFEPLQQIPPDLFSLHHPFSCPERNGADRPTPRDALFHPSSSSLFISEGFSTLLEPPPLSLSSPSSSVGKRFGP